MDIQSRVKDVISQAMLIGVNEAEVYANAEHWRIAGIASAGGEVSSEDKAQRSFAEAFLDFRERLQAIVERYSDD